MRVQMAQRELELGGAALGTLRDSNDLRNDWDGLRTRLSEDGYLLIRGLHKVKKVQATRDFLLSKLAENDQLNPEFPIERGVIQEGARGGFLGGSKALTRDPIFLNLVESPEIMGFFAHLLAGDVLTYDYKWLRVVGNGDFTGAHYDIVYMGRGTQRVYTCWMPITDVPYEMGPLALLIGSDRSAGYERVRQTYGRMDVDRDKVTGWFTNDPLEMIEKFGGQWQTTEFQMGDALIFGMYLMHGSLTNVSDRFRITTDTRYQRAEEPVDERWVGENPIAHYAWMQGETVSMEDARQQWEV